jgi:hypothetical protein
MATIAKEARSAEMQPLDLITTTVTVGAETPLLTPPTGGLFAENVLELEDELETDVKPPIALEVDKVTTAERVGVL